MTLSNEQKAMKWVKASERLPEKEGDYYVREISTGGKEVASYFEETGAWWIGSFNPVYENLEWLDESAQPEGYSLEQVSLIAREFSTHWNGSVTPHKSVFEKWAKTDEGQKYLASQPQEVKGVEDGFTQKHLENIRVLQDAYKIYGRIDALLKEQRILCLDNLMQDDFYQKHKNDFPKSRILHAPAPEAQALLNTNQ